MDIPRTAHDRCFFFIFFSTFNSFITYPIDLSVSYQSGPLKRIERCVAKAETDYSDAKYPTSAKILDIIRCACVYDNCDDLVAGMKKVAKRIGKQDTELKKVCVRVFFLFLLYILARKRNLCFFFAVFGGLCFRIDCESKELVCCTFSLVKIFCFDLYFVFDCLISNLICL